MILEELTATGYTETRRKRIERKQCRKYIMSGGKILEDCGLVPGGLIPIVPFYGKRWVVNGIERCMGHVRLAKDAQRLTNSLMSWLADMAGRKKNAMYSNGRYRTRPYTIDLFGRGLVVRTHRISVENSDRFIQNLRNAKSAKSNVPSRYAYPALEKHSPKFRENVSKLINEVVAQTNQRLGMQ
jgi:hypothetical protein